MTDGWSITTTFTPCEVGDTVALRPSSASVTSAEGSKAVTLLIRDIDALSSSTRVMASHSGSLTVSVADSFSPGFTASVPGREP